ncbi:MAG: metal-dependent hydrolase [Gemmatimonadetes bacterium]|nr:metal-dependent hydrolase [Gemmatimonadota bacterium]
MDNLCHSLAGAVVAQTGFAKRLPRATLLGIVAANIPDVDALTRIWGDSATVVSFRRGWTHGVLAIAVWAVLLSLVFSWWNGRRPAGAAAGQDSTGRKSAREAGSLPWQAYLPLAAIAVVSHPALDLLNSYGIRLFMPFSDRWFYGDTLFIVDPPLLVLFAAGWFVSSRALASGSSRPHIAARAAIGVALAYIVGMKAMSGVTRTAAEKAFGLTGTSARQLMVAPRPLLWLRRDVVVLRGSSYDRYPAEWRGTGAVVGDRLWSDPTGAVPAVVAAVRATQDGARFLQWSRFPYFVPGTGTDSGTIFVGDLRYSAGTTESWAGIRVTPAPGGTIGQN